MKKKLFLYRYLGIALFCIVAIMLFFWQRNKNEIPRKITSTADFYDSYEGRLWSENDFFQKKLQELCSVYTGKLNKDGFYEIESLTFYGSRDWKNDQTSTFYTEFSDDEGIKYRGPYSDNGLRLWQSLQSLQPRMPVARDHEYVRMACVP